MRDIDKRRLLSDSAYLKGVDIPFHRILIVVGKDTGGGEPNWSEIFIVRILNIFSFSTRIKSPMNK